MSNNNGIEPPKMARNKPTDVKIRQKQPKTHNTKKNIGAGHSPIQPYCSPGYPYYPYYPAPTRVSVVALCHQNVSGVTP